MVCDKKINIPLRKSIITCASVFLVNIVHKCIGLYLRGIPHFKKRPAFLSGGCDFNDLVFSGVGENAEEELGGYKRYYQETKNEAENSWDIDWTWDIMESEELIEAPTSASFKFDICMNNPILISGNLEDYKQYEEQFARLEGANINIKVIVQGMQYRNTNDRVWKTLFEQNFEASPK